MSTTNTPLRSRQAGSEQDEIPLDAAKRELQEETGLTAAAWTSLGSIDNSNGVTTDVAHLFLARNLTAGAPIPQGDKQVELRWMLFVDAVLSVMKGGDHRIRQRCGNPQD